MSNHEVSTPYGGWIFVGLSSAGIARARLHDVIAADRESAPCWRWKWVGGTHPKCYGLSVVYARIRYRWEQRR